MPISTPTPPREIFDAVRSSFQELASKRGFGTPALRQADPRRLAVSDPHGVYTLGLRDIVDKREPADAQFVGWRWLVQEGQRTIASAEVGAGPYAGHGASEINEGPFVRSSAEALEAAEKLPETRDRSYEPRLLKIPAVYLVALWLHPDDGDDLFVVLPPAPYDLKPDEPYRWPALQRLLAPHARTRLEFDDRPKPRRRK
jgi:hypothetical protein